MRHLLLDYGFYSEFHHAQENSIERWALLDKPYQDIPGEILETHAPLRFYDLFPMEVHQPDRRSRTYVLPIRGGTWLQGILLMARFHVQ